MNKAVTENVFSEIRDLYDSEEENTAGLAKRFSLRLEQVNRIVTAKDWSVFIDAPSSVEVRKEELKKEPLKDSPSGDRPIIMQHITSLWAVSYLLERRKFQLERDIAEKERYLAQLLGVVDRLEG